MNKDVAVFLGGEKELPFFFFIIKAGTMNNEKNEMVVQTKILQYFFPRKSH